MTIPNTSIDDSSIPQGQWDDSEIISESVSTRGHLGHPHHLDEHLAGARFGIPSRLRRRTIPIFLGDLVILHHF